MKINQIVNESPQTCAECGGPAFTDLILAEKKDACYSKVRSRYKVWPSAYASGALVQCRKKGAANWGNSKNEDVAEGSEFEDAYDRGYSDGYDGKGYNSPFPVGSDQDDEYEDGYSSGRLDYNKMNQDLDEQGVAEGYDAEYDDEAGMAETNLHTIARAAQGLLDTIDDKENLPEWVQEKIAKVEGMMVTAWDYLKSQEEQGVDPRVGEQLEETYHDDDEFFEAYGVMEYNGEMINEAEYQGRKVALNKPMRGGTKKFFVYVKNEKGNVVKVSFGDKNSKIKKHIPGRRKNFRARHNCDNPGPKTKARYWSCRNW